MTRYVVVVRGCEAWIERRDGASLSFDRAREEVAAWYRALAERWDGLSESRWRREHG